MFSEILFFYKLEVFDCVYNRQEKGDIKVSKSRKRFMVSSILPNNKQKNSTLLLWYLRLNCFRSFFGRIEETINCFWDLLTFNKPKLWFVNKFHLTQIYDSVSLFKHREWVHAEQSQWLSGSNTAPSSQKGGKKTMLYIIKESCALSHPEADTPIELYSK